MRFHVVSLPHTNTTSAFSACAFTEKVRKFCNMMKDRGHVVFLYAGSSNEARVDELVTCLSEDQRAAYVATLDHYTSASFDVNLPHWKAFNLAAIEGIRARAGNRDFICVIGGSAHASIADAFPNMLTVEFGVGYHGTFSKYRVFESYAHMHAVYAAQARSSDVDGQWFDAVIPNYFETIDFPVAEEQDNYFAFVGRMIPRKGLDIAIETCRAVGARLVVAGPGVPPPEVEYCGVLGPTMRGVLLSRAKGFFAPSKYVEPFCGAAVEAMLCGTPVITTDWGAFTETVLQAKTGFRCRTLQEFVFAAQHVHELDRTRIRQYALDRYSTQVVGDLYVEHFNRLSTLWGKGWYERKP